METQKVFFSHGFNSTCKIMKKEVYEFVLDEDKIIEAKKRDWKNPFFYKYGMGWIGLYSEKGKLRISYYHSYDCFDELLKNHKEKEHGKNFCICSCGKSFIERDLETARKKFNKHIDFIKKIFEENKQ